MTKQANWLDDLRGSVDRMGPYAKSTAVGGLGGATLSGLTTAAMDSEGTPAERRKRILRNALMGGVMGGAAGASLPAISDALSQAAPPLTQAQRAANHVASVFDDGKPLGGLFGNILGGGTVAGVTGLARSHGATTDIMNNAVRPWTQKALDNMKTMAPQLVPDVMKAEVLAQFKARNKGLPLTQRLGAADLPAALERHKLNIINQGLGATVSELETDFNRRGRLGFMRDLIPTRGPAGWVSKLLDKTPFMGGKADPTFRGGTGKPDIGARMLAAKDLPVGATPANFNREIFDRLSQTGGRQQLEQEMLRRYSGRGIETGFRRGLGKNLLGTAAGFAAPTLIPAMGQGAAFLGSILHGGEEE